MDQPGLKLCQKNWIGIYSSKPGIWAFIREKEVKGGISKLNSARPEKLKAWQSSIQLH